MIGYGISTRNRREDALKCLQAVWRYGQPDDLIVVCDDASSDGTSFALKDWSLQNEDGPKVEFLWNPQQVGVAGTKFRIVELLLLSKAEEIILIEDDVMPTSFLWTDALIETGKEHKQAHLLYLPTEWKYGKTFATTPGDFPIEWKQFCSGMIMYFRAALLREVGNFDTKFNPFGYEHNALTAACLLAQGLNPDHNPHCTLLERQNLVVAQDVISTRPKMSLHENDAHVKEMQKKIQMAHYNKAYYDGLMQTHRAKFRELNNPGSIEHREKFFPAAVEK